MGCHSGELKRPSSTKWVSSSRNGALASTSTRRPSPRLAWLRERQERRSQRQGEKSVVSSLVCFANLPQQSDDIVIENLTEDFCDDFVCTSSPAVEQSVRQLANNVLQTVSWSRRQCASRVKYSDGLRSFEGSDKYDRMTFLRDYFDKCKVGVTSMEMLDLDTAVIEWNLSGEHPLGTVDLECTSTFEMNVITGKVENHRDEWRLASLQPAALVYNLNKIKWSLGENVKDQVTRLKDGVDDYMAEDEDKDQYFVDPMDPKKYIQQQDTTFDDAVQLGLVLTLLYSLVKILSVLL